MGLKILLECELFEQQNVFEMHFKKCNYMLAFLYLYMCSIIDGLILIHDDQYYFQTLLSRLFLTKNSIFTLTTNQDAVYKHKQCLNLISCLKPMNTVYLKAIQLHKLLISHIELWH